MIDDGYDRIVFSGSNTRLRGTGKPRVRRKLALLASTQIWVWISVSGCPPAHSSELRRGLLISHLAVCIVGE